MIESRNHQDIPLYISNSYMSTEGNLTGSWRYMRPVGRECTAPCGAACPVGEDIARIEMLCAGRDAGAAWETIVRENPLPAVCGRVCFHPCEAACNRAGLDMPVGIRLLERFIGDMALSDGRAFPPPAAPKTGQKVAVVGSGPFGLSAAYFLSMLGYGCDVFEAADAPGGLLRWGIPAYRLPAEVLAAEIRRIEALGVAIRCNAPVTTETLPDLRRRYQAVFIGAGYGSPIRMNIPGEDLAADGLALLRDLRAGKPPELTGTAAVIGGGNTAADAARSLLRLGVKPIIVYRRRKEDMPAFHEEIEGALAEGADLMERVAPVNIEKDGESLVMTLQKMKTADAGADGRARVVPDGEKQSRLTVDHVFRAIGAGADPVWRAGGDNVIRLRHCALVGEETPFLYGGDLTTPTKSVADAVASGKQAAMALDAFLKNGPEAVEPSLAACRVGKGPALSMEIYLEGDRRNRDSRVVAFEDINTDYFDIRHRVAAPALAVPERIGSFAEIEQTLSDEAAAEESGRCFNCGVCNHCDNCRLFCPEMAVVLTDARRINLDYCKGCGICVTECPRSALILETEP